MSSKKERTILFVDDDEFISSEAEEILSSLDNVSVFMASNGQQALKIINKNKIDVMITDIDMPILNGYELVEELSWLKLTKKIKIIIQTGTKTIIEKHILDNIDDYILKPYSWKTLQKMIDKVMEETHEEK